MVPVSVLESESITVSIVLNYVKIDPFGMGFGLVGYAAGIFIRCKFPAVRILALDCTT